MNRKTQNDKILAFLQTHGSITALEAANRFGCMRLAARIADLREKGNLIESKLITVETRDGKTRVAEYSLKE